MGRSPCCEKEGLKKGPWTPEEDKKLVAFIEEHGHGSWRALPAKAGLQRCGKSCRLRWTNYLRPDIKRGKFSLQEEQTIIQLHALLGNRWSAIATHLAKRTDNEIKNYWNTHLKKRLTKMGIDPVTHKPKTDALGSSSGNPKDTANLSHMAQWESARLEAEARLVRESKLNNVSPNNNNNNHNHSRLGSAVHHRVKPSMSSASPLPCLDILKAWQSSWSTKSNPTTTTTTTNNNNNNNNTLMCMLAMDDLESPTSTFDFPHLKHSTNNNNNNTAKFGVVQTMASLDEDEDKNDMSFHDIHISALGGHSPHNVVWFDDVNDISNNSVVQETNGVQNLTDVFVYASDDQNIINDIVQQDQSKSYWNSILSNLVNASPSGSPVF